MNHLHRRLALVALVLSLPLLLPAAVHGAHLYLNVPSITGENPTPGYPGAMAVNSLAVTPDNFSVVKLVDKATPQIATAIIKGTPLGTASGLFYNSVPSGPPDATLPFLNVLGSSQNFLVVGGMPGEQDGFSATTPANMYLKLPGITGEGSTPGYPGVMQVTSFSLTANDFTIIKRVDSASPAIQLAVLNGTPFATANMLFYNSAPSGPPDTALIFHDVLGSSYQLIGSVGDMPMEQDTFNFTTISQPTPEPGTLVLMLTGIVVAGGLRVKHYLRRLKR